MTDTSPPVSRGASVRLHPWHVDCGAVLLMAGVAVGAWTLAVKPLLADHAATRELAVELAARRDLVARRRAARQDVESRLTQVNDLVGKQSVKLEPRTQLNQRLAAITDLAARAGIGVDRLSPGAATDGSRHGTMSLRLSGKAPYDACERFIADIHDSYNDVAVTTLRLMGAPGSTEPVALELDLLWFTAPDVKVDQR